MSKLEGKSSPIVVGFVGAGMVAELHHRAMGIGGSLQLAGIVEPNPAIAEKRSAEWGCQVYADYSDVLDDSSVEALFILSPEATHEKLATKALESGKHVFVEKPVGSPDAIKRLQREAKSRGLICMPGHNYAYDPDFVQTIRLLREGALGDIRAAWITYIIKHPETVAQRYGGILSEVMIHHAYLSLALFGIPTSISAKTMQPAWLHHSEEDQAWMTWDYQPRLSVHHFASFAVDDNTHDSWLFMVKVLGTQGGATYTWRRALYDRPLGSLGFALPAYEDTYIYEQQAFARAILGASESIVSGLDDAYRAARILELAKKSDREGRSIEVCID